MQTVRKEQVSFPASEVLIRLSINSHRSFSCALNRAREVSNRSADWSPGKALELVISKGMKADF